MVQNKHHALAREAILAALTAYTGITTADGAGDGSTLIDANLKGKNDFISGKTVLIGSGDALYEDKGAASFDNTTGAITVESPFSAQIKKGTLFRILNAASADEVAELLDALVSYRGTTTADGAFGGGTLVCSDLTTKPDFDGNQVVIKSGPYAGQVRDIDGVTTGGTVTPHTSFGGTITEGTRFSITAIRTVPAEVAQVLTRIGSNVDAAGTTTLFARLRQIVDDYLADGTIGLAALEALIGAGAVDVADIEAKLDDGTTGLAALKALIDAAEAKLDKLAGEAPVSASTTDTWNTGEADVVSIGADDTKYKLHSLLLSIHNLVGTIITVRMYMQVNGAERKVYDQAFDATSDPPGLWIVNGTVGIHEVLRVTLQSNNAADDDKAVDYDYMLEAM